MKRLKDLPQSEVIRAILLELEGSSCIAQEHRKERHGIREEGSETHKRKAVSMPHLHPHRGEQRLCLS